MAHALARLFAQKRQPATRAAAETPLMRSRSPPPTSPAAQPPPAAPHTRRDTAPDSKDRDTQSISPALLRQPLLIPRHKLRVMLNLRRDAILPPIRRNRPHAMRTDRHNLLHLRRLKRLQPLLRQRLQTPDHCPAAAPDRPCTSPSSARRNSFPGNRITRAKSATISRPLGSYPPMHPSHRQYSCDPSKIGDLLS